jgi:hypothetical protein
MSRTTRQARMAWIIRDSLRSVNEEFIYMPKCHGEDLQGNDQKKVALPGQL